jgi:hypothetical protein
MLQRNELWVGLVLGLLMPIVGMMLFNALFNLLELKGAASGIGFSEGFRERTSAIIAIALNLILLNLYRNRRWENAMRGIVIATSLLAMFWLYKYGLKLF